MTRRLLKVVDSNRGLYENSASGIGTWQTIEPLQPCDLPPLDKTPHAGPGLPAIAAGWHRPQPRPGQGYRSQAVDDLLHELGVAPTRRAR